MMMKVLRLQASDRNYINSVLRTSICILSGSRQDHLQSRAFHTSCTNPPALAYVGEQDKDTENAAVGYATVYPLSMFLRVLAAQLLILLFL